jgi:Leucine Rich repeat
MNNNRRRKSKRSDPDSESRAHDLRNHSGNEAQIPHETGIERVVPENVRIRQRAVAEREAARLARPERREGKYIGHADRKKSAVSSTPFGFMGNSVTPSKSVIDGLSTADWCGPFSLARQMISKREEIKRQRELEEENDNANAPSHPLDFLTMQLELDKKRKEHPSLQWKARVPSDDVENQTRDNLYSKRRRRMDQLSVGKSKVPSLFNLCVAYLVDNFEYVDRLGVTVDNSIRSKVISELVACNKLNGTSLGAIAEDGIEALEIVDCADITESDLCTRLRSLLPSGLTYLSLDNAGRCVGPQCVRTIVDCLEDAKQPSCLQALSIGGAYLLKDEDAAKLISCASAKGLESLEFRACPLLGDLCFNSIFNSYKVEGSRLLELSFEDITWTETKQLDALITSPLALQNVKNLSLRRLGGLNDDIVSRMLDITSNTLERLDLSDNHELTDQTLASIRQFSSRQLVSLDLSGLRNLTAMGLEATFMIVEQEDDSNPDTPPRLRYLNLSSCHHEAVTDEVIKQICLSSKIGVGYSVANHGISSTTLTNANTEGLVTLNVQGSSVITDNSMEELVKSCSSSLVELDVSFCTGITNKGLGFLVDNCKNQLRKLSVWGNASISDEFLDGNRRANDPDFQVVGTWMKNHSSRAIR